MNFIIRPLNHTWLRFYFLLCLFFLASIASAQSKPLLTLANTYDRQVDLSQYYVSEKYDGVRAYWNGKQLLSRSGKTIPAPKSFLEQRSEEHTSELQSRPHLVCRLLLE